MEGARIVALSQSGKDAVYCYVAAKRGEAVFTFFGGMLSCFLCVSPSGD